ncbi:MAG: lipooligosaccharide transport system ATP-binding protein [Chloroflexota bacterium]|jgi:lipooligosaccharide transport system ATP-binding protein|nr:lipooligosaccharide transport system ATP-binding protein [Chloroflexota bacterium]
MVAQVLEEVPVAARAAGLAVMARGLVKAYGDREAVAGIDLDIPVGGAFGVLGPNGAGKTTLIRMITCVSPPTAGVLQVLGQDVARDRRSIKRRLGVVPQGMTLDTDLRVRENLVTFAAYHDVPRAEAAARIDELLQFTQLADRGDDAVEGLSGGMQRRLLIARALVNDPEMVVLDEPTTGLDPQARHFVWERLRSLKRLGKTLLLTTHYMEEAAQLCDALIVVDSGRIIAAGSPLELVRGNVPPRVVEVQGDADLEAVRAAAGGVAREVERVGDRVLAYGDDAEAIAARIRGAGVAHTALLLRDATLEDVFLRLTGHALVEG